MFKDCVHVQLLHKRKRDIRNTDSDISFSSFKTSMLLHCFFSFIFLETQIQNFFSQLRLIMTLKALTGVSITAW